jgi:hypothetical protein
LLALAALLSVAGTAFAQHTTSTCDASNTLQPGANIQSAISNLTNNQVICLDGPGNFESPSMTSSTGDLVFPAGVSNVTLRKVPGHSAPAVFGHVFKLRSNSLHIYGLALFAGPESGSTSFVVSGDDVVIQNSNLTNGNQGRTCVDTFPYSTYNPDRLHLYRNRIYDCGGGNSSNSPNHDHGVYLETGADHLVDENWIYENNDRGVQIYYDSAFSYPAVTGAIVTKNVISDNCQAQWPTSPFGPVLEGQVNFGGPSASNHDNHVNYNVVTYPTNQACEYLVNNLTGTVTGQQFENNCLYGSTGSPYDPAGGGGISVTGNFTNQQPNFVNRGYFLTAQKDYTVQNSSCGTGRTPTGTVGIAGAS